MDSSLYSRIAMLGPSPDVRDGMASVIQSYRAFGLAERWPIDFLATRWGSGLLESSRNTVLAVRDFGMLVGQHRRVVAHVHTAADPMFWLDCGYMMLALAARCPVVLQLHGGGFERLYDRAGSARRALITKALEAAKVVVVPSEALRAWVAAICRSARTRVVPNPVATATPRTAPGKDNIVLFLGKLEEEKGIFDLLEAMATVRRALPDARLVCAGEGDRGAVARYADRLGVREAVEFTGWLGPSGKRAVFDTASALVATPYRAGLPMSVLEAMAAGVPVIASSVGAISEAIVDGTSGFLVAPGDTATLARLLQKLLAERSVGARIGAAARESVRLRFAPERVIPRLEDIYASLGVARAAHAHPQRDAFREAA